MTEAAYQMSNPADAPPMCPSCQGGAVRIFYEAPSAPVNSVLLLDTREQALNFPTGDVRLGFCDGCGFIYNTAFDPRLVEYSSRCEETQGFSPFFRAWHEGLARRLIDRYSLHSKKIIEIGCGKGEFLALLCDLGDNRGIGFDPAYVAERTAPESASRIRFIADFYTEKDSALHGDFVCCKMTLEHIPETARFVKMVRASVSESPNAHVFFQVPDVMRVLEEEAFWDVYYEHCSYFSAGSLARLFRAAGFKILEVGREYNDQYVTVEACRADGTGSQLAAENDLEDVARLVDRFAERVPNRITEWRKRLEDGRGKGKKTVVWGAGSKGVTFLSIVSVPGAIDYAVDINPNMAGHFMAKTGIEIVNPETLRGYRPDIVIVMNPVYREEISAQLMAMDLRPEVISI
jgi:SAM-dependent methyltransferase